MTYIRAVLGSVFSLLIIISPSIAFAQVATTTATTTPALDPHNQADVSTAVADYFADVPPMIAIAKCESNDRQYDSTDNVLSGGSGGMLGVFQINGSVHKAFALSLGDDITTLQGNMAYARYLYDDSGTQPWDSSKSCWAPIVSSGALPVAKAVVAEVIKVATDAVLPETTKAQAYDGTTTVAASAPTSAKAASSALSINLKLGSVGAQVVTLQQLLNAAGYKVAKSGAGSPGSETNTFGPATKSAVQRFQCAHNIACSGIESATGYGLVGAKTRAALMVK